MHCDTVRADLLDFSNGETGPVRVWTIRRHLATCAGCAEELAALQKFKTTLRHADLVPPEVAFAFVPTRPVPVRRVLAIGMAVILIGGLFLLPTLIRSRRNAQNPGAAIAAALGRVNTWHFSGWKLIDGQQVPWEVWGRRSPWLYYERVGDTITWSDGKQRLRVFPPNPALNRPHGLIIQTSEDQANLDRGFLEDPAYQTLVNSRQAGADFGDGFTKLYAQTLAVARFRRQNFTGNGDVNQNKLYTISKRDWLPMTYQLHFDNHKFARDTEYLEVRYDIDLPVTIVQRPTRSDYNVVDFTPSAKDAGGFRVSAEPAGLDTAGNVVIVARGWLGADRLTPGSTFSLNVQPYNGRFSAERRSQTIKYLYAAGSFLPLDRDITTMPFTPLEPSEVAAGPPDTFLLSLSASPEIQVRSSDTIYSDGSAHPVTRTESLINKQFHWRLSLPKPDAHLRCSFPSAYDLAEQRRVYYFLGYDYRYTALKQAAPQLAQSGAMNTDGSVGEINAEETTSVNTKDVAVVEAVTKRYKDVVAIEAVTKRHPAIFQAAERRFRARAAYWQERKTSLPSGAGHENWGSSQNKRDKERVIHAYDLQLLALCYHMAGDSKGQKRALRQLLAYIHSDLSFGDLHRQAQYTLRTGQFPGDANYKGPS